MEKFDTNRIKKLECLTVMFSNWCYSAKNKLYYVRKMNTFLHFQSIIIMWWMIIQIFFFPSNVWQAQDKTVNENFFISHIRNNLREKETPSKSETIQKEKANITRKTRKKISFPLNFVSLLFWVSFVPFFFYDISRISFRKVVLHCGLVLTVVLYTIYH